MSGIISQLPISSILAEEIRRLTRVNAELEKAIPYSGTRDTMAYVNALTQNNQSLINLLSCYIQVDQESITGK